MGQTSVGRLHGRLDVLQTSFPPSPSCIQDGGVGNDINQDLGRVFRSLLRGRCKMATLPLPAAILDDLICGTGNEVIQDGRRKRKGRHFAPPPQWGSKNSPYTTVHLEYGRWSLHYNVATWAAWRLKSPVTRLFIQQLLQSDKRTISSSVPLLLFQINI